MKIVKVVLTGGPGGGKTSVLNAIKNLTITEDGYKNIEDIKVGEKVYALDLETNNQELKEKHDYYVKRVMNSEL